MDIHAEEISQTAAAGTWSVNTHNIKGGICYQIVMTSATASTTFDFKITDEKSLVVYDTLSRETTATGTLEDEVRIPMRGIYTLQAYNSTRNELFTGRILIRDQ